MNIEKELAQIRERKEMALFFESGHWMLAVGNPSDFRQADGETIEEAIAMYNKRWPGA